MKSNSKGISPIIAAVLLIAFTMSVAVLAGPFMTDVVQTSQSDVDEEADRTVTAAQSNLEIVDANWEGEEERLGVIVRNSGQETLERFVITIAGDDVEQEQIERFMEPGDVEQFIIDQVTEQPEEVTVESSELPVRTSHQVDAGEVEESFELLTSGGSLQSLGTDNDDTTLYVDNPCVGPLCEEDIGSDGDPVTVDGAEMTGTLTVDGSVTGDFTISTIADEANLELDNDGDELTSENVLLGDLKLPRLIADELNTFE